MDLAPGALQKHSQAADADDQAVGDGILGHRGGFRGGGGKRPHQQSAGGGKHQPADKGQDRAGPGSPVSQMVVALPVITGHQRVDTDAGAHRDGRDDQLDRIDDGERRQAVIGKLAHKVAVHDIVHGLDQLGEHHRRRDPHQDGPDALRVKKAV